MSERKTDCPCTWDGCERHGDCKACKAYHHGQGQKTSCEKRAASSSPSGVTKE